MRLPGKISKAFSDELFRLINPEEELPDAIKADPKRVMRVVFDKLLAFGEIDELEREIELVLDRLGTLNYGFFKSHSIEELVIGVKHYLIAWSTMKDLMTNLINICFDLGIHETDLSFGAVVRNKKVKESNLPSIFKRHGANINAQYTDKQRNDAIHRGKLLDDEINEFRARHNKLYASKYGLLNPDPITDDAFESELKRLNKELRELVELKRLEYSRHFQNTMDLNQELARELARITADAVLSART